MYKLFFVYLFANIIFFATFGASNALSVDTKLFEESREVSDLNSDLRNREKNDSNIKLEEFSHFEGSDTGTNFEEISNLSSENIVKRCIDPVTKQKFECPLTQKLPQSNPNIYQLNFEKPNEKYLNSNELTKNKRSNAYFVNNRGYPYGVELGDTEKYLQNLLKIKLPEKTKEFEHPIDDNINKNNAKANCRENKFIPNDLLRPIGSSIPNEIGSKILDHNRKNHNKINKKPFFVPLYYTQNIQHPKETESAARSSRGINDYFQIGNIQNAEPKFLGYLPQNFLAQYLSTNKPKKNIFDNIDTETENIKFIINDCVGCYNPCYDCFEVDFHEEGKLAENVDITINHEKNSSEAIELERVQKLNNIKQTENELNKFPAHIVQSNKTESSNKTFIETGIDVVTFPDQIERPLLKQTEKSLINNAQESSSRFDSKTEAAMTVKSSSGTRPVMKKSIENCDPEVTSPEYVEMIVKLPIQYYSPKNILLDYRKNHQDHYYSDTQQLDVSQPKIRSKRPAMMQPEGYRKYNENEYMVGIAENPGIIGRSEYEDNMKNMNMNKDVRYLRDYGEPQLANVDYNFNSGDIKRIPIRNRQVVYAPETVTTSELNVTEINRVDETSTTEIADDGSLPPATDRNNNKNVHPVETPRCRGILCLPRSFHNSIFLGRLLPQYRGNSDFMYSGDGVRLPLNLDKLNDGSFSLTLSNPLDQLRIGKRDTDN